MKILIVCDKFLPLSEQFLYNQLKAIDNHDIYLICRKKENKKLYHFNFKKTWVWYDSLFKRLRIKIHKKKQLPRSILLKSKKIIQDYKIDLLYFHFGTTAFTYQKLIEESSIPVFCSFHGFDATRKMSDYTYANGLKAIYHKIDKVIVPSHHIGDLLISTGIDNLSKLLYPCQKNITI